MTTAMLLLQLGPLPLAGAPRSPLVARRAPEARAGRRRAARPPLAAESAEPPPDLPLDEAWRLLNELTAADARRAAAPLLATPAARARVRAAVLAAAAAAAAADPGPPPDVLLGVLASDARLAARALRGWTAALGVPPAAPEARPPGTPAWPGMRGPVYVKYASRGACYAMALGDARDRGVLLQLGGGAPLVGHLPLGLFGDGDGEV